MNSANGRGSFLLVFYLWVAGLCAAGQYAKFSVLFPWLRELYPHSSNSALGLLVSIVGILGVVLGLFAGLMVARIGYKTLLIPALLLASVLSVYQATLPSYGWMLGSRLLEGGSHLLIVVAAPTLIARHSLPRYRGLAMTLWSTFFGVSFALTVWLGLPLLQHFGPSALFLVHGVLSLLMALVLARYLPSDDPGRELVAPSTESSVETSNAVLSVGYVLKQHIKTYRSSRLSAPALGWLLYTLTFVSLLTILPDQVISGDRAGLVGVMPLLGIAVALLSGVFLLPRFSAIAVMTAGFILSSFVVLLFALGVDPVVSGMLLFGTLGLVQGSTFAAIPELNKDTQSQAYANGAMAQMGNLGNSLGTPLFLMLVTNYGINGMVAAAVACYLLAALFHSLSAKARRRNALAKSL